MQTLSLKNQFNSNLNRELRSLGDITIVDTKPDFVVSVIVIKLTGDRPGLSGFSVATLVTTRELTTGAEYVLDFKLRAGSLDDVKSFSQSIIADFDATTLEPNRKVWNSLHKPPEKSK